MRGKQVREVYVERVGDLKLLVGGKHGYVRVRGGQGPDKDKYQGYTVDKKNTTASFKTAREAAIALAELERDIQSPLVSTRRRGNCAKVSAHACSNPA